MKITQAVILGAGLGARLRPLTNDMPKVMAPFGGKPLLEHNICLLRDQGISDFIVNVHYLPEKITGYFGDGARLGVSIQYSDESDRLLETAGALKKVAHQLNDHFIFAYGDHMHFFDFAPAIDFHFQKNSLATIILKRSDDPRNGEVGEIDPLTRRIVRWHIRPHAIVAYAENMYVNSGLYVLSKKVADYIPAGRPVKFDAEVTPLLVNNGVAYGFPTGEKILDVGAPEKYARAVAWYEQRQRQ